MLSLIIPSLKSMKITNFDVYLEPMVEELHKLWKGVKRLDVLQVQRRREFNLKGILNWIIHDFPGYGLLSSCQHQG